MPGIDPVSLAYRPPNIIFDWSLIHVEMAAARDLDLKPGDIVNGVIEYDGDVARFFLKFNAGGPPVPLRGNQFQAGPAAFAVTAGGANEILLKPLPVTAPMPVAVPAAAVGRQFISDSMAAVALALRPQDQAAIAKFFAPQHLETLLRSPGLAECVMPFLRQRMNTRTLTPAALKVAVAASGLWAEPTLAAQRKVDPGDFKVGLWKLLEQGGADGMDQTKQSLHSLDSAQSQALQAQARGEVLLSMVIPFVNAQPLHLSFFREAVSEEQPSPPFVVNAYTNDAVLGELWLKTVIEKHGALEILMWAVHQPIAAAAASAARVLGGHLAEFGLTLKKISIINGPRPQVAPPAAEPGQMVNIQI